jgi:decaprenylphospho-beta-D-erythro-pentofuranosid-2-ulose 2-reductase
MKRVVIFGATSEIAMAVERLMAADGLDLCLVARSPERLESLKADLLVRGAASVTICSADLADTSRHRALIETIAAEFGAFDTVLLAYGTLLDQQQCQTNAQLAVAEIMTNFASAASLLTLTSESMAKRKQGTIAVITSVAGDRGRRSNYVYGAAKGGLSLFVEGLRSRMHPLGVRVVTIKPGPVDTPMTARMAKRNGLASSAKVGADIYRFLKLGRGDVLYTPFQWRWIMRMVRAIPDTVIKRLDF